MKTRLFIDIAMGRSRYSLYFLLIFMVVAPTAFFTDFIWLDHIAWLMLVILGVFISITGVITHQEALASANWPRVPAWLISASLKYNSTCSGGRAYAPDIKCDFQVDGTTYKGTEYDLSASYGLKSIAEDKVKEVKQKPLYIYYKPTQPEINVIHPGVRYSHYVRTIVGLLTIILPILFWSGVITVR